MSSLLAPDARVNENGPSSRHLEVTDAQLSAVSAPAVGPLGGVPGGASAEHPEDGRDNVTSSGRTNGSVNREEIPMSFHPPLPNPKQATQKWAPKKSAPKTPVRTTVPAKKPCK